MAKKKSETENEKDLVYVAQVLIRKYCGDKNFNFNDLKIASFGLVAITFLYKNTTYYIVERKDDNVRLNQMKYDSHDAEYKLVELCNIPFDDID
ncbi:hypothetical protein [Enterococcus cecorum]|uniref:hypothetical protein n=1 Tax=Enterococcus cecorum TaxID=44008 RepID=UPI00148C7A2D|nr:hypothetical protein [Enterococcus cecorum]